MYAAEGRLMISWLEFIGTMFSWAVGCAIVIFIIGAVAIWTERTK
jgi:hypothetical protein